MPRPSGAGQNDRDGSPPSSADASVGPTVSVVVPTYARPDMLAEALGSVRRQTYDDLEVVVVDDHSPEPAAATVEAVDLGDLRVRCLRHDENRGANAARNTGIEAATGEFVAFLDDDDRWRPGMLDRAVAALRTAGPDVGLVTTGMRIVDDDGTQIGVTLPDVTPETHPFDALVEGASVGSFSRLVVRADAVERAGPTDERFPCWQDWDWEFQLAKHTRFTSVREPLVVRRRGDHGQITDEFDARRDVAYPLLREKHRPAARARGRSVERRFEAELARTLGAAALSRRRYGAGRRYLLRALRYDPSDPETYLYLGLAAGGRLTYDPVVRAKRRFAAHVPNP